VKLGVFDSGLGGLLIAKSIRAHMPDIDMMYLGDTLHLPYGNRSDDAIYAYTQRSMDFMFGQGCSLIVIACNTASAAALRRLQQEWLPKVWPGRNIIGVVVPTLEAAIERGYKKLGLIGTNYIVRSNIFADELVKISPDIKMYQQATPLLVPLIENDGMEWAKPVLARYLQPFIEAKIECLMLGCTHYPFLRQQIAEIMGPEISLLSQDDIIPAKLHDYLLRHPEYEIDRGGRDEFFVSDVTDNYLRSAHVIYGKNISIQKADLN
jgi:glutamate racemase